MTISARIASLIKERGLLQKTIAETVGVTPSTVNTWIKNDNESIPSSYIMPICRLLDVTPEELLDGTPRVEIREVIPDGYVKLNDTELNLINMLRELSWESQNIVINAAIMERRASVAQGIDGSGKGKEDVG